MPLLWHVFDLFCVTWVDILCWLSSNFYDLCTCIMIIHPAEVTSDLQLGEQHFSLNRDRIFVVEHSRLPPVNFHNIGLTEYSPFYSWITFSITLTTQTFDLRRLWWFATCSRKPIAESPPLLVPALTKCTLRDAL